MDSPQDIKLPYHKDVILRFWVGTTNPAALHFTFRLYDAAGTVLVEKTTAAGGVTTASGIKSDGTAGYYAQVDLATGSESYGLSVDDARYYTFRQTDAGARKPRAYGAWVVFAVAD